MSYSIKEMYYTLQGEGGQAGRAAVFCRFTGCNLWTGREKDRSKAVCQFCDTDFVGTDGPGGGRFKTAEDLVAEVESHWTGAPEDGKRLVVCTGGEPLLQLDQKLVEAFHARNFMVAIETNGTKPLVPGLDWVCVSPKADAEVVVKKGHELKLVYPQPLAMPDRFDDLEFDHFFLQPMDGPDQEANTRAAVQYCLEHPKWRLSLQTHKYLGID